MLNVQFGTKYGLPWDRFLNGPWLTFQCLSLSGIKRCIYYYYLHLTFLLIIKNSKLQLVANTKGVTIDEAVSKCKYASTINK